MLPTVVGFGAALVGGGALARPAGWAADDVMLIFAESGNGQAYDVPAGWALVPGFPVDTGAVGTTGTRLTVFWRLAVAGDAAPTMAGPINHMLSVMGAFRDCETVGDPWDVIGGPDVEAVEDVSLAITGDTTTVADCLVVLAAAHGIDTASARFAGAIVNADLANLTNHVNVSTTAGNGGGLGVWTGEKAAAGAYAASTQNMLAASAKAFGSIALRPPAAGGTTPVGRTATSTWNVRATAGRTRSALWAVRQLAGRTRTALWNLRALAGRTRTASWAVRSRVGALATARWNGRARAGGTRAARWNVRQLAARSRSARWNVRATAARTTTARWAVRSTAAAPGSASWAVRQLAAAPGTALWALQGIPTLLRVRTSSRGRSARTGSLGPRSASTSRTPPTRTSSTVEGSP